MNIVMRSVSVWGHANIRTWEPDDPLNIAEVVTIDIGPKNKKASDSFTLRVATPTGLARLEGKDGIVATRPLLVMCRYDFDALWRWLEKTVSQCDAPTWPECVQKLQRYFDWEYDGYKES
jgi:hypothetical protein